MLFSVKVFIRQNIHNFFPYKLISSTCTAQFLKATLFIKQTECALPSLMLSCRRHYVNLTRKNEKLSRLYNATAAYNKPLPQYNCICEGVTPYWTKSR